MKKGLATATVIISGMSGAAFAQSDDVIFSGTVSDTCTVVAGTPGVLAANAGGTVLGSAESGGSAGTAAITTTSTSFEVDISVPSAFDTAPTGGGTNATFAANYSASGATTASGVSSGTPTALGFGSTTLSVNASSTKSTGVFPAGSYQMTSTVTCSIP